MSAVEPLLLPEQAVPAVAANAHRLYEKHAGPVFRYCRARLRSREDAEDALQTTFDHAFGALRRGTVPEFERSWLLAIARNVCASHWKASHRRSAVEIDRDPALLESVAESREPAREELMGLPGALAGLTDQQRRAILLREWQGFSYQEIAAELDLSQAAVEALIFRARRALAAGLNGEPSRVRQTAARALDVGSALGWIKSALGVGTGVKVAVATVVVGGAIAASPFARSGTGDLAPVRPSSAPPALGDHSSRATATARLSETRNLRSGSPRASRGDRPAPGPKASPAGGSTPRAPEPSQPSAPDQVGAAESPVASPIPSAAASATESVAAASGSAVETAEGVVEGVAEGVAGGTGVGPVQLPSVDIVGAEPPVQPPSLENVLP